LPVDLAARRCQLFGPLARGKDHLREIVARCRTALGGDDPPRRAQHLAARYWEHTIRDDRDFAVHFDNIHFNPVKHGLVSHPADWRHSTFRRCVANGLYPAGWTDCGAEPEETGERQPERITAGATHG